ncbi:MAG: hypothetical protein M3Q22_09135 [Actinomycetota bacterium]|nr:hypothetical protein [Actinomycetota bacterium]
MRIPVFLDGWDIDCCLAVPAVGDRVLWSLIWFDEPDHPAAADIPWASSPSSSTRRRADT